MGFFDKIKQGLTKTKTKMDAQLTGIFAVGFSDFSNRRFAKELRVALAERSPGFEIDIVFGHDGSDFFLLVVGVKFDLVDRRYRIELGYEGVPDFWRHVADTDGANLTGLFRFFLSQPFPDLFHYSLYQKFIIHGRLPDNLSKRKSAYISAICLIKVHVHPKTEIVTDSDDYILKHNRAFCNCFYADSLFVMKSQLLCQLRANLRLAEELGARIATVYGDDTPLQIAEYARASGVTKIVLGRSNNKRFFWERSKNLVDRLNALAPDLDIHIIPDTYPAYRAPRKSWNLSERFTVKDALRTLVILAVCTMVGLAFAYLDFSEANIIMIYQLGVLVVAMVTSGRLYSLAASILSILIFNFFFTVPLFTLHFNDKSYLATFLVMFLVAFLSSSLTTRIKRQARLASRQAYRTQVLLEASQTLQKAEGQEAILEAMAVQLRKLLERTALYYPVLPDGTLGQPRFFPVEPTVDTGAYLGPDETAVASWVQKNNKHAGATTNTLPNAKCLYLAVRGEGSALAVASLADTACIILTENAWLDEDAKRKADQQGICVLGAEENSYRLALQIGRLLS